LERFVVLNEEIAQFSENDKKISQSGTWELEQWPLLLLWNYRPSKWIQFTA
jgi:hypothetical protein